MDTSTRPDVPVDRAAARRNYIIFTLAAGIGLTILVAIVTLLLV
jgi:hypothetical protein